MKTKYSATIVGTVITAICLATAKTFIVPLLTFLPVGLPLELIFGSLLESSSYTATASSVLLILSALFILIGLWFLKKVDKDNKEQQDFNDIRLIFFFIIQLVIIHPMVFYVWAIINSKNAADGQFMFGIVETFPISSIIFIVLGFTIDLIKNKKHLPTLAM